MGVKIHILLLRDNFMQSRRLTSRRKTLPPFSGYNPKLVTIYGTTWNRKAEDNANLHGRENSIQLHLNNNKSNPTKEENVPNINNEN